MSNFENKFVPGDIYKRGNSLWIICTVYNNFIYYSKWTFNITNLDYINRLREKTFLKNFSYNPIGPYSELFKSISREGRANIHRLITIMHLDDESGKEVLDNIINETMINSGFFFKLNKYGTDI